MQIRYHYTANISAGGPFIELNLFSDQNISQEVFIEMVEDVFNENRSELIYYSFKDLIDNGFLQVIGDEIPEGDVSEKKLGNSNYPNYLKSVNIHLLQKFITEKYPNFSTEDEVRYITIGDILV